MSRQETRSEGSPDVHFELRRIREKITIRNSGFSLFDPRVVTGNLALTLGGFQDHETVNGTSSSANSELLGYAFDTTLFATSPYSGTLFANRSQNFLIQPFGRTDLTFENRGATFRLSEASVLRKWGMPYLSSNIRAEQQHIRETTTSALGQSFQRDELRNIFSLDGHDGFQTSDLDWRYEFNDFNNQTDHRNDFRTHAANVNYSLDFGPTLNRRWDSRMSYYKRESTSPYSIYTVNEQLRIDHYSNFSTGYRYLFTHAELPGGGTTTQTGAFDVRHQLRRNLTSTGQLTALHETLPAGIRDMYEGRVDFQYRRALPWNGTVFAHFGGRGQLNDNRLTASDINVTDEAHAAPAALGAGAGFLLDQSFVLASAVVVVDTRGGARLPAILGVDYDIVQEGNFTRIVPLITSAVIQPGDPLAVSYTYQVDPSIKYRTIASSVNAGLDFRWIAVAYGHEESHQNLLSGQDSGFLQDIRKDTAQLDLRGEWQRVKTLAGAAYVNYDSTRLVYTQYRYYGFALYRPVRSLGLGLNADDTKSDYRLPPRESDARSLRVTADWYGPAGWSVSALIGRRIYRDTLQPTETVNEAIVRARLDYGKLAFASSLTAADRVRGGFETSTLRVDVNIVRRF